MYAFVVRRKLATVFILRSIQLEHKSWCNNSKSYQFKSLWVMPTSYLRASAQLLFHWQKQLSKFTVCYGDHLCRAQKKHTLPGEKIQGISFKAELWLQRREVVCWTLTQKTGKTKAQSPGGGFAWAWRIIGLPSEGALLDLDNCLQRSLDTSTQMPLPIKHSVACSFTPQQLLSNSQNRSKYVSDDSRTPPHLKHPWIKKSLCVDV